MFLHFDVINILIATVAVVNTLYGLTVFSRNRENTTNQSFFFLTMAVSIWGVAMLFLRSNIDPDIAVWAARILYASAALIPFASIYFSSIFPEEKRSLTFFEKHIIPLPLIAILVFVFLPHSGMINGVTFVENQEPYIQFSQILYSLYIVYIVGYFSWVYVILFRKLFFAHGVLRIQLAYILVGTLTTTGIGVFTNLLLPFFGIFSLNWVGQIGILAMITSILYSVLKHHLFSIKVIATEIFVVILELTLFTQIFIAQTFQERVLATGIFAATFVVGILLVRSVLREVQAREEIEELANNLEKANIRLKELDKLKSQFLSVASHDLRAPLTAIRNFMSILLDGTYGKLPAAAEEGTKQVFDRATDMAEMVDNYLNVSRIEQGRMKYDFENINLAQVLNETAKAFSTVAQEKNLELKFEPLTENLTVHADEGKMREVIENLINNAINYTLEGSISITTEKQNNKVHITFSDTGIGMSQKTISKLFGLFSPGDNSRKYNPKSTGVGLYITKAHVEAHKGTIRAESDGEGKGSRFIVELPLA